MFQILIVVGVNFSRQSVILSSQEKSILCPKSLHSNLYSADFIDEKILTSIKGMSLQPFLCPFVLMTNKNVYVKKFSSLLMRVENIPGKKLSTSLLSISWHNGHKLFSFRKSMNNNFLKGWVTERVHIQCLYLFLKFGLHC